MGLVAGAVVDGRYRISSVLGVGGMGVVYKADDIELGRTVALKVLLTAVAAQDDLERFKREIMAMARLDHKNIVRVFSAGLTADNCCYLAMELLSGRPLSELLVESKKLPWRQAVELGIQVCQALQAVHAEGITHRDVKPHNIMIEDVAPGVMQIKLLDFGLSKPAEAQRLTQTGALVGSVHYMSPEAWRGDEPTASSDVYALACTLFEVVSGRLPFEGESAVGLVYLHAAKEPPRLRQVAGDNDIPEGLETLLLVAMDKSPAARPSAAEFKQYLQTIQSGGSPDLVSPVLRGRQGRLVSVGVLFVVVCLCFWIGSAQFLIDSLPFLVKDQPARVRQILSTELGWLRISGQESEARRLLLAAQLASAAQWPPQKRLGYLFDIFEVASQTGYYDVAREYALLLLGSVDAAIDSQHPASDQLSRRIGIVADFMLQEGKTLTVKDWNRLSNALQQSNRKWNYPLISDYRSIRSLLVLLIEASDRGHLSRPTSADVPLWWIQLGDCLWLQLGRPKEAEAAFRSCLASAEKADIRRDISLANLRLAQFLFDRGQAKEAQAHFDIFQRIEFENRFDNDDRFRTWGICRLVSSFYFASRRYAELKAPLDLLREAEPFCIAGSWDSRFHMVDLHRMRLALCLWRSKRFAEAREFCQVSSAELSHSADRLLSADELLNLLKADSGEVVPQFPDGDKYVYFRTRVLAGRGDNDLLAAMDFKKLQAQTNGTNEGQIFDIAVMSARALLKQGKTKAGLARLRRAIEIFEQHRERLNVQDVPDVGACERLAAELKSVDGAGEVRTELETFVHSYDVARPIIWMDRHHEKVTSCSPPE